MGNEQETELQEPLLVSSSPSMADREHERQLTTETMSLNDASLDDLVGMIDDDEEDFDAGIIPRKDSDEFVPSSHTSAKRPKKQQSGSPPLLSTLDEDNLDVVSDPTDDEYELEEKTVPQLTEFNDEDKDKRPEVNTNDPQIQQQLDEAVMLLLHPDFYQDPDPQSRAELLKKQFPEYRNWNSDQLEAEVINVADAMSVLELTKMYDQLWHTSIKDKEKDKDDEKQRYAFEKVDENDLHTLSVIPRSFFGKKEEVQLLDNSRDGAKSVAAHGLEYISQATSELENAGDLINIGGLLPFQQGGKGNQIPCAACGVDLKFKKKRKKKKRKVTHYIGYKCKHTQHEWVFHDYLCVKLRRIKEAIKDFVFEKERDENKNIEDENALIKIETNTAVSKDSSRLRPIRKTTPRSINGTYRSEEGHLNDDDDSRMDETDDSDYESVSDTILTDDIDDKRYKDQRAEAEENEREKSARKKNLKKLGYIIAEDVEIPKYIDFRRFRTNIKRVLDRLNAEKKYPGATYQERFGDLPPVLLFCDLNEFGVAIFEFVSNSLKSKMRKSLWHILEWLALEMPTNELLHLLKKHTHLLSKHELVNYDKICKATMEGSKFPIACTLRLSAFMHERAEVDLSNRAAFQKKMEQYVNVARKLLREIESDHLFALLLMIPTDIGHQNVIEIALKYDLTKFLEEPRIVRVFNVVWFSGYDFLDPNRNFSEPDISVDTIFDKLWGEPGRFFFSPFGKFVISSILYVGYLGLFSVVTYQKIYNYPQTYGFFEVMLWIASAGYVLYEILEFFDSPAEYFSSMANYWDVLIALDWIFLYYLRFLRETEYEYDSDGELDHTAQRNTSDVEMFMAAWSIQCIMLWTRVASLFKISERAGPLIRMIMNMLGDIFNFFLIWMLFFIGGSFAAYYIIGGDLSEIDDVKLGTFSSVSFYIFKALIGQQNWDKTQSQKNPDDTDLWAFDGIRSNMLQTLLMIYSIFGTILLLNLLIAMMASSYEAVKNKSLQEVNKQKIDTIYDLDRSRSVITPPLNVLAYFLYMYWYAFEIVAFALTFGHRQFNEEWFSPINHELHQYSEGDNISFASTDGGRPLKGLCVYKVPKVKRDRKDPNRIPGRTALLSEPSMEVDVTNIQNPRDLVVEINDKKYPLYDKQITGVSKNLFKRRKQRIPSLVVEAKYCRYCRCNISSDHITISEYLHIFEATGQHIDPDDKDYIKELVETKDEYGIPTPLTCRLCPNCYRPFKVLATGPDVLNRMMFTLEIVSYGVFWGTLRWVILLAICIPALIVKIIKFILLTFTKTLTGKTTDRKTKSIMNTSEENDDYRAKVRQVSKQEEKIDAVVRRIDTSVTRLENKLLGDLNTFDDDDDEDEEQNLHNLRSDEFNAAMDKMKTELANKVQKIRDLLSENGY